MTADLLADYDIALEALTTARQDHDDAYRELTRLYRAMTPEQREVIDKRWAAEAAYPGKRI